MGYCGQCGHPVEGRFCGHCGAPVAPPEATQERARPITETDAAPPWPPPDPRRTRRAATWLPYAAVALLVIAVAGLVVGLTRPDLFGRSDTAQAGDAPAAATATSSPTPPVRTAPTAPPTQGSTAPTPTSASASPTSSDPHRSARRHLIAMRDHDLPGFSTDGHLLVMLAGKCDGIRDPHQTTSDGGHVFHETDILAETRRLHRRFGDDVRLLKSTDFGTQQTASCHGRDHTMWVTVYDPGTFDDQNAAEHWCAATFSDMSAQRRADYCFVRKATPPHK